MAFSYCLGGVRRLLCAVRATHWLSVCWNRRRDGWDPCALLLAGQAPPGRRHLDATPATALPGALSVLMNARPAATVAEALLAENSRLQALTPFPALNAWASVLQSQEAIVI